MHALLASALTPFQWYALGIPVLICAVCAVSTPHRSIGPKLGAVFFVTTVQSLLFSRWADDGHYLTLHLFPACALALVMAPKAHRPNWRIGYCLVFFSQFLADVLCSMHYAQGQDCFTSDFFCGVGGAGFADSLFMTPLAVAAVLFGYELLERLGIGHITLSQVTRQVLGSPRHARS